MPLTVCTEPGCPELTDRTRCPAHRRQRERARGTRQQRGYDADYDRMRRGLEQQLAAGEVLTCWRCDHVVFPHDLSLGHCDDDRSILHGAEHLSCNVGSTTGDCPHPSHVVSHG